MSYYCEFKLFETSIWAETERERGAGTPDLPLENYKLYFLEEKLEEAIPPPPVEVVWIRTRMSDGRIFACSILSKAN